MEEISYIPKAAVREAILLVSKVPKAVVNGQILVGELRPTETPIIKAASNEMASSLGLYVKRWQRWDAAGLQFITIDGLNSTNCFTFDPSAHGQSNKRWATARRSMPRGTRQWPRSSTTLGGPLCGSDASTILTMALWRVLKYPT